MRNKRLRDPIILIVAARGDLHIPYVTRHLDSWGVEYVYFDPHDYPARCRVSVSFASNGTCVKQMTGLGSTLDLDAVSAVWNRARARPCAEERLAPEQVWWVEETSARFLSELYECVDCLWLPERPSSDREPFRNNRRAVQNHGANVRREQCASPYNKLNQLALAGRLGFSIPRTLVTNDPDQLINFFHVCQGRIISKTPIPLATTRDGEKVQPFTREVHRRDLADHEAVRFAAVTFQENILKKVELRVTVIGGTVLAAEIRSTESNRTLTDWRHYPEHAGDRNYGIHQLPEKVSRACRKVVQALGLCFGAIDLILTPEGDYVFLEINPGGQWAWIEDYTGLPISQAVADLLVKGRACANHL